ncbi:MAG: indolepyruvate ferredoxin oxidoreductase subunit alpha [Candidatus Helarchaeota archaeon]
MNNEDPYESLRISLNKFLLRVPKTEKFHKLLKMLYTPEEASLLSIFGMPYVHEEKISRIAKKANKSIEKVEVMLNNMVEKGTIFVRKNNKGKKLYSLAPFIPGIYEFYTMSKNDPPERKKEVLKVLEDYYFETFAPEVFYSDGYPYFRVLPHNDPVVKTIEIDQKIPTETKILPFEVASSYIRSADYIAVGKCACRMHAEQQDGKPRCDKPLDVCLVFDRVARYWADKGIGRLISYEEAEEVLRTAAQSGLVHCTTNNQVFAKDMAGMICNCCPCCCFILQGLIKTRGQGGLAKSNFQPKLLKDKCKMCLKCIKICPLNAIFHHQPHLDDLSDDFIDINEKECIGCGACATNCPHDAITLVKVQEEVPELNVMDSQARYIREKTH